jgi:hypothetical protein
MPSKKQASSQKSQSLSVPVEMIERRIYLIRGQKVMLDSDLAKLYEVTTFNLNKAVKRNLDRFPEDFMFQLTKEEMESLRFQFGISKPGGRGGRRYLPFVFTEQGVAMLSSVLNSPRAIQVNIAIMRAFVRLREMLLSNEELNRKFSALERKLAVHDAQFKIVFDELRKLIAAPERPRRAIGFTSGEK